MSYTYYLLNLYAIVGITQNENESPNKVGRSAILKEAGTLRGLIYHWLSAAHLSNLVIRAQTHLCFKFLSSSFRFQEVLLRNKRNPTHRATFNFNLRFYFSFDINKKIAVFKSSQ